MTKKQINKIAKDIIAWEKILESETSTEEEKVAANKAMNNQVNLIMALKDGMEVLFEINAVLEKHFDNK